MRLHRMFPFPLHCIVIHNYSFRWLIFMIMYINHHGHWSFRRIIVHCANVFCYHNLPTLTKVLFYSILIFFLMVYMAESCKRNCQVNAITKNWGHFWQYLQWLDTYFFSILKFRFFKWIFFNTWVFGKKSFKRLLLRNHQINALRINCGHSWPLKSLHTEFSRFNFLR